MKKILIIGAGQLGSRHLQALKSVKHQLEIFVVDPSEKSLEVAKERYDSINIPDFNNVIYINSIKKISNFSSIDIAIISTSSNVRASVTVDLIKHFQIEVIIFEKILFNKKDDYFSIEKLLNKQNIRAYVNCPMRMMDFYKNIKENINGKKFKYVVSGGQFGLVTNLIHYLDHISFLNNSYEYITDTRFLEKEVISSKRESFLEINGFFQVNFENGTQGFFNCEPNGNAPITVQVFCDSLHFISLESEGRILISKAENGWKWEEIKFKIPFQSQLTTILIQELLDENKCFLPTLEESIKLHLPYLDSMLDFVNENVSSKFDFYPFT